MRIILAIFLLSSVCRAENTNKVSKAEKERKTEHSANKIVLKSRPKGSTKESDWKVEREYPLMFANNKKDKKKAK